MPVFFSKLAILLLKLLEHKRVVAGAPSTQGSGGTSTVGCPASSCHEERFTSWGSPGAPRNSLDLWSDAFRPRREPHYRERLENVTTRAGVGLEIAGAVGAISLIIGAVFLDRTFLAGTIFAGTAWGNCVAKTQWPCPYCVSFVPLSV